MCDNAGGDVDNSESIDLFVVYITVMRDVAIGGLTKNGYSNRQIMFLIMKIREMVIKIPT